MVELLPILAEERNDVDVKVCELIADYEIKLACREGCDFCCYLRVEIFGHEMWPIIHYIRSTFSDSEIAELKNRLDEHVAIVATLTRTQHRQTNMKCPLLVNSRCSIYPVRPYACRLHNSTDVDSCENAFKNPQAPDAHVDHDPILYELRRIVLESQAKAAKLLGFDVAFELGERLLHAITSVRPRRRSDQGMTEDHSFQSDTENGEP